MKGKSHFLVRVQKVRKDQQKIAELIEEKKESGSKVRTLSKEIDALKSKIQLLEDDLINNDDNLEKLSNLFKLGIIDENGHPIINQSNRLTYFEFIYKFCLKSYLFILLIFKSY